MKNEEREAVLSEVSMKITQTNIQIQLTKLFIIQQK